MRVRAAILYFALLSPLWAIWIAVLPNELYFDGRAKLGTLGSVEASKELAFALFTGDSKDGHTPCSDRAIADDIESYFERLKIPVLYTPGDNEWTDCHRRSCGSYDPLERLDFLRRRFFGKKRMQGPKAPAVERMRGYPENSIYIEDSVLFVTLHLVGSANGFSKSCKRGGEVCTRMNDEAKARMRADIRWLERAFARATDRGLPVVLIAMQADIFSTKKRRRIYRNMIETLRRETLRFDGEILLIHGDTHRYRFDKPLEDEEGRSIENFYRLETFGGESQNWIKLEIEAGGKEPFRPHVIEPGESPFEK